jgi:hypothetical protein
MKISHLTLGILISATAATAQTQLVRGDVDRVQNSQNFQLDCTTIRLVSSTVNLQQLHDQSRQQDIEYEMQVNDVSAGGVTILDVLSARAIPELMDMGNIRLGRSDSWEVLGAPGSSALVFVNAGNQTRYLPAGSMGTWLLNTNFLFFQFGVISSAGQFRFDFQPPNDPSLVGQTIASQALVIGGGSVLITNAQCKQVRAD